MRKKRILIVGAGFSGAVIAQILAQADYTITLIDQRKHIAGNCHTYRDDETNILIHQYGPHIFHTDIKEVWQYVQKFGEFVPYQNRVKAYTGGRIFSLPINLLTINQFFSKTYSPEEAKQFIQSLADQSIKNPQNFEEQALSMVGKEIYESFFYYYTKKQWGMEPRQLPASILKRLPLRFNYDDNYFNHPYQGMPKEGYTQIIENMIADYRIELHLNTSFDKSQEDQFDHIFYSGMLDEYFNYQYGELGYRTLEFEKQTLQGDAQGCAVMNYCDDSQPFTRISQHNYFAPWEKHQNSICFTEFSKTYKKGDIPFYPIRLAKEKAQLDDYIDIAKQQTNITFIGRLGTYRYLDMDVTIKEAMDVAKLFLKTQRHNQPMPAFLPKSI